jgi:hypothetical protein
MPLNPDSLDILNKVRKGTPARFVLCSKGVKVLNLVAYRKGVLETAKKEAKTNGAGELSHGVVDGSGQAISFKLARIDGFEEPPVKDIVLKAFLGESNFDCKPTIEIVDVLPEVGEEGTVLPPLPSTPPPSNGATTGVNPTPNPTTAPQTGPARQPLNRGPQQGQYRSRQDWDRVFAALNKAPNGSAKKAALEKTVAEWKREKTQAQSDTALTTDAGRELDSVHAYVAQQLKAIMSGGSQTGTQTPPSTSPPKGTTTAQTPPQTPPQRPTTAPQSQEDKDRDMQITDAKRRVGPILTKVDPPYTIKQLKDILAECETDGESDFGKVCNEVALRQGDSYDVAIRKLQDAEKLSLKYIKDHPDPTMGKLPSRVVKRREYCNTFLPKIRAMRDQLYAVDASAKAMADTYGPLLASGQAIPNGVADEIYKVLGKAKISDAVAKELKRIADEIKAADQQRGYTKLAAMQKPTDGQKAEILLSHGCYKAGGGGTSDVRLLRNPDKKTIAFAFKGADGEAQGALDMLNLPTGACAIREDLCSTLTEDILAQTGIDFGFPKAKVVKLAGQTGALIEGIRGKTVDPEELSSLGGRQDVDPSDLAEVKRCLDEIPDKITPKSLQKVVLFSTLACQWDCKWGNLMVENEQDARPIDGGGAFPTQDCVDSFGRDTVVKPLAIMMLTQYPPSNYLGNKVGKTLPQALQPMDAETVKGLMKLDANQVVNKMKTRRDEVTQKHPELAPPPHNNGLVDDATLNRVKASIEAAQNILRKNPQQTLLDFATAYEQWWCGWITANRTPGCFS